jgi:hypothetical protein
MDEEGAAGGLVREFGEDFRIVLQPGRVLVVEGKVDQ